MPAWKKLQGEKGIYFYEVGDGSRSYMLRTPHQGKRKDESLAGKTLVEVREIRAILEANIERGTPPFTYKDLVRVVQDTAQAQAVAAERERKRLIEEDKKLRNNTVAQVWENIHWPKRLEKKSYSKKDFQTIATRWKRLLKPYFGQIPMRMLTEEIFSEFAKQMRETPIPPRYEGEKPKRGEGVKPKFYSDSVINKCLGYMRRLWNVAKNNSLVEGAFPGEQVIADFPENPHKVAYLELDEIRLLLDTVYSRREINRTYHDVFCYVTMGLFLGLRAGEIHPLDLQTIERGIIEDTKNGDYRNSGRNCQCLETILLLSCHCSVFFGGSRYPSGKTEH